MKTYKQAKIPKGYVEIKMRGAADTDTSLSFKRIVPLVKAGEIMAYLSQFPEPKKIKKLSN